MTWTNVPMHTYTCGACGSIITGIKSGTLAAVMGAHAEHCPGYPPRAATEDGPCECMRLVALHLLGACACPCHQDREGRGADVPAVSATGGESPDAAVPPDDLGEDEYVDIAHSTDSNYHAYSDDSAEFFEGTLTDGLDQ